MRINTQMAGVKPQFRVLITVFVVVSKYNICEVTLILHRNNLRIYNLTIYMELRLKTTHTHTHKHEHQQSCIA